MLSAPLPPQPYHTKNTTISLWTDERLWGHRWHNEQTPWLILLEFLSVFQARQSGTGQPLEEPRAPSEHESFQYELASAAHLRYLVFNNPHLQEIEASGASSAECWRRWHARMAETNFDGDFRYLERRFGEFSRFVRVVEFFQSTAIEPHRQRRWSTRFVFPYGPGCLYADTDGKNGVGKTDRLFFARSGELLYLMLARSGHGGELAAALNAKLMRRDEKWNRLAGALQPDSRSPALSSPEIGYLPYAERPEYAALARDWLALLQTDLPGAAALDPLMRITGLHLIRYVLRRAHEETGNPNEPRLLLEIAAPRRTLLYDLSRNGYDSNRRLPARAIEADLQTARESARWQAALSARQPALETYTYLKEHYRWSIKEPPGGGPEQVFEALRAAALDSHGQHMAKVVPGWSREIGLAVSRRGAGAWYCPDDAFLKTLVLANVEAREDYHRFLARLYERYGIVIGVTEAERAYDGLPTDERAFVDNANRLEQRLRTLGLLQRLSDDCAYVINPFKASS